MTRWRKAGCALMASIRITSYNVCYTKLLREQTRLSDHSGPHYDGRSADGLPVQPGGEKQGRDIQAVRNHRITSYNVCYTKLLRLAIDLPKAPPPVKQMTVQELAERLKAGTVTVVDVRSESERARAS